MSNKQSMKLYTEEQVLEIIANVNREVNVSSQELLESIGETPIKIPNHFEICDEAHKEESSERHYAFMRGAKWMRDKIQGGNNEQQQTK
jgi:hypothetical protein